MAVAVLGLLMLVQLPSICVTGPVTCSMVCGGDRVAYSILLEQELFYINRHAVDEVSFCKSLKCYNATECFSGSGLEECRRLAMNYCGLDLSLVELPKSAGRKVLLGSGRNESIIHHLGQKNHLREEDNGFNSFLSPKTMAMAVPGMLLLCCSLLCPCFRSRRKEIPRTVLAKDPSSMDSISSFEVTSALEKVPGSPLRVLGSPLRVPGSPLRVPGSPLRVPPSPSNFSMSPKLSRIGSVHLSMNQVIKSTHNFSASLQIGEGGFGTVYRAQLQDGQVVAIKRAKKEHINTLQAEFSSEVELLAKIEHRNLVKLLGYVDKGNERIIITEYVPNGTLREHLDGQHGKILDFKERLEISIDVAHALTYLHLYAEKQVIHRDVKSSNILLTESMRAKVADFGFARLGPVDADQTHISTKVKGTVGYLDPEYLKTYQLTPMSDVYSFGILMIEILTGRRPVEMRRAADERVTVRWAFKNYNEGNLLEMLDPLMTEVVDAVILSKMFGLAFQCAAPTRLDRPNMKEVGEQLWVIRMDYIRSGRSG